MPTFKKMKQTPSAKTKARTQVCFLLDETQSMYLRKDETIKGFNGYIEELKKDKGDEVLFTFTTFNKGGIKTPYKAVPIKEVQPLTSATYNPQNWTPLYDAIGTTICAIKDQVKETDLVIFTILTDGEENSSREYTQEAVKKLLQQHEKDGWKIVFLGVGIDAFKTGSSIGLNATQTFDIGATPDSSLRMYGSMAMNTSTMRSTYSAQGLALVASQNIFMDKDRKNLKD